MCLQRENAVKKLLDVIGPEDPVIARSLDSFLLRGSYGVNSIHNAVHGNVSKYFFRIDFKSACVTQFFINTN